jgi:hypothetical protein
MQLCPNSLKTLRNTWYRVWGADHVVFVLLLAASTPALWKVNVRREKALIFSGK